MVVTYMIKRLTSSYGYRNYYKEGSSFDNSASSNLFIKKYNNHQTSTEFIHKGGLAAFTGEAQLSFVKLYSEINIGFIFK